MLLIMMFSFMFHYFEADFTARRAVIMPKPQALAWGSLSKTQ